MPSPPIPHSVSDANLSPKNHMFSPTSHALYSRPSSSNIVGKHKLGRKSDRPLTSENLRTYDINYGSCQSPYYKGLLDQSLAINEKYGSSCPAPQNQSHPSATNFLSSGSSPYYKGLTDYSLVLRRPRLPSHESWRPVPEDEYECSPYYRGLTDNSLAIREPQLEPYGHGSSLGPQSYPNNYSNFNLSIFNMNLGLCLGSKEEIIEKVTTGTWLNSDPGEFTSSPPKGKSDLNLELEVGKKLSLGERVSERIALVKDEVNDNDLVGEKEKKPLRESISTTEQIVFASESSRKDGADLTQKIQLNDIAEEGNVREYIWANKHQPKALVDFICNKQITIQLKALVKEGSTCNHFIFEGPAGVGKRSMIRAMLREVFGPENVVVTEEYKTFNLKGEMVGNIQVRIKKSPHHVEVNLSETKGYEQHVIVDLFKETYGKIIDNSLPCSPNNYQAIILYEAEKLSTESLLYIKWMLERCKGCNKVFFCCSDESKLQTVKPICTTVRLSPPSSEETVEVLEYIGKQEGIELSRDFAMKFVEKSKNNLRQAIRSLEATCRNKDSLKKDELILTGWEDDISNIAKNIIEEQSPKQLYIIRQKLQSLMIHNVPPDFIYKSLVSELNSQVDEPLRSGIAKLDKEYNNVQEIKLRSVKQSGHAQNKQGELDEKNNELPKKNASSYLKVEEFIAKFMSWYKNSLAKGGKQEQLDVGT